MHLSAQVSQIQYRALPAVANGLEFQITNRPNQRIVIAICVGVDPDHDLICMRIERARGIEFYRLTKARCRRNRHGD